MAKNKPENEKTRLQQAAVLAQQAATQMKKAADLAQQSARLFQKAAALAEPVSSPQNVVSSKVGKSKKRRPLTEAAAKRIRAAAQENPQSATAMAGFAERVTSSQTSQHAWEDDDFGYWDDDD